MICAKHWRQLYTTLNYSAWNAKNLCNDLSTASDLRTIQQLLMGTVNIVCPTCAQQ
uniref:E7-C protein n=1 Tax=Human papillomavirus TaxID=10566 RepID=Q81886_9PAPI|nr:E7-C [Human papillomavirus]